MTGGAMPLDAHAAADLSCSEGDFEAAEEQLSERGLLVSAPLEGDVGVASELATLLSTAISPDVLGVLRVDRPSGARDVSYFSLTSDCLAHNRVDASGQHVFTEFDTLNELLLAMTATAVGSQLSDAQAEPLDKLLPDSEVVAVLMAVARPAELDTVAQFISWAVARGGVWLAARVGTDGAPRARPITANDLREKIRYALQLSPIEARASDGRSKVVHVSDAHRRQAAYNQESMAEEG